MGKDISQTRFSQRDFQQFRQKLNDNLLCLRELLATPGFGLGQPSFGAELELYIIDDQGRPKAINQLLCKRMNDPQLTLELNRFNLEYNFVPVSGTDSPFKQMRRQMNSALEALTECADLEQARILPIGILPTLKASDMGIEAITDLPRYHALAKAIRDKRGADFHIHIEGADKLDMHWSDVSLEGANTSFQFHYRVNPQHFAAAYNAAQLVSPLVLGLAANSPLFLGQKLWQETRIALFKQSIDYRMDDALEKQLPARVMFGTGWVRKSIYELFAEGVYLFEPLLPICGGENDENKLLKGEAPALNELRLHLGSIWNWNRPIYDPADGGHLRIELRALPAGPSSIDMVAHAALASGLIRGLQEDIDCILPSMPFRFAEQNFYRAARYGLNARLFWPNLQAGNIVERPLLDILGELLPVAEQGLSDLGICDSEIDQQMDVVRAAVASKTNGATWQTKRFDSLCKQHREEEALNLMLEDYYTQYRSGKPVHEWSDKC